MNPELNRRRFLGAAAGGIMTASCSNLEPGRRPGARPPNLVYVFPDEWRGSALGFLDEEPVKTPNIDRFAAESLVLTDAVSAWPVCSPYRAMLMTGQYPHANGVISNCTSHTEPYDVELRQDARCWSDVLADRGYSLGYIGKWHLDSPRPPYIDCANNRGDTKWNEWCPPERRHGFQYWHSYGTYDHHMRPMYWDTDAGRQEFQYVDQYGPEHEADLAVRYINNEGGALRDPDQPFALVVANNPPHMGYHMYPERYKGTYDDVPDDVMFARPNIPPAGTRWGDHYRRHIRDYFTQMTAVDDQFGRILAAIDQAGLAEDTIVVFTSDHGDCVGANNQQTKANPYEESFRVPFIMRWKGQIEPRRDDLLINSPDIYPTLLDLMGFDDDAPPEVEGVSLAETILTGEGPRPDSQLYMHVPHATPGMGQRGVRTHRWTFVVTREDDGAETLQLWDRTEDPYQLNDVAAEKPEVVAELREAMNAWLRRTNDPWLDA